MLIYACAPPQKHYASPDTTMDGQADYVDHAPMSPPPPPVDYSPGYSYQENGESPLAEAMGSPPEEDNNIVVRSSTPPSVDSLVDQLSLSSFVYNIPDKANIKDEIDVIALINPMVSVEELKSNFNDGVTRGATIQISRIIKAKLDSSDFEITPITPERQVVFSDRNTKWLWTLKPKSAGERKKVKITITAILNVDGDKSERYIDTYTDTINVEITTKQKFEAWLDKYWQWAWSALLIPIGGFFWARRKSRQST